MLCPPSGVRNLLSLCTAWASLAAAGNATFRLPGARRIRFDRTLHTGARLVRVQWAAGAIRAAGGLIRQYLHLTVRNLLVDSLEQILQPPAVLDCRHPTCVPAHNAANRAGKAQPSLHVLACNGPFSLLDRVAPHFPKWWVNCIGCPGDSPLRFPLHPDRQAASQCRSGASPACPVVLVRKADRDPSRTVESIAGSERSGKIMANRQTLRRAVGTARRNDDSYQSNRLTAIRFRAQCDSFGAERYELVPVKSTPPAARGKS